MSTLAIDPGAATVGLTVTDTADGLSAIREPATAGVIWRRALPEAVTAWLDGLDAERLPIARRVLHPNDLPEALDWIYDEAGTPGGPARDWLSEDIAGLAGRVAALLGAPMIRLRLDAVRTNACRRFHVDALTARLICTYRGRGTEYGTAPGGDPSAGPRQDPTHVLSVPRGAPVMLRGTLWPEMPASGLLHRSPPIEGTGETRLMMVLDPLADPDED